MEQSKVIPSVLALEKLLVSVANREPYEEHLQILISLSYKSNFHFWQM